MRRAAQPTTLQTPPGTRTSAFKPTVLLTVQRRDGIQVPTNQRSPDPDARAAHRRDPGQQNVQDRSDDVV